jgi:lipoprotein
MKTKFMAMFAAVATSFAAMVSCTPEENKTKETVFPTIDDVTMEANTTKDITFTAEDDWTLVSDQSWCKFDDNGVQATTVSGTADEVKVTVSVSDEGLEFSSATATIDMTMGGKTQNVFTVTRLGKERVCELYYLNDDDEIVKADEITITYNSRIAIVNEVQVGFKANFPWKVKSVSEGIAVDYESWTGEADKELTEWDMEYVSVKDAALAAPFEGKIVVSDLEGNNEFEFTVNYTGLGENDVKVVMEGMSFNGITFSNDGFLYSADREPVITDEKTYNVSVLTKDMQSKHLVVEIVDYEAQVSTPDWLTVAHGENGQVSISVSENTGSKTRSVYVLFFPSSTNVDNVDLSEYFDEDYFMGKNGFMVNQKGVAVTSGYKLVWASYEPFDGTLVPFSEYPMFEGGKPSEMGFYQASEENTYVCELSASQLASLIIAPVGYPGESPVEFTKIGMIEAPEGFMEGSQYFEMGNWEQSYPAIMLDFSMLEGMAEEGLMFNVDTFLSEEDMNNWSAKSFASIVFVIQK